MTILWTLVTIGCIVCSVSMAALAIKNGYDFYTDPRITFNEKMGFTFLVGFIVLTFSFIVLASVTQ